MKAQFEAAGFSPVKLVAGGGGVFEITVGDQLAFSKKSVGRFPNDDEVLAITSA